MIEQKEPIIESENAPKCPLCGTLAADINDVNWYFSYKLCQKCGRNYLARKTARNPKYESKKSIWYTK